MKRIAAFHPSRGFFTLPVAIAILAVSGGLVMLAGPPPRDSDRRAPLAQPTVRANDVGAVKPAADATAHAQVGLFDTAAMPALVEAGRRATEAALPAILP